jgi:hypothetical protein
MTGAAIPDSGFLPRSLALPHSQDYAYLRARGLHYIERLAHDVWTDHNIHDPGITLLELFCYAITDVAMRAGYPIEDLLAEAAARGDAPDFHLAHQVLVCKPVSFDDLRRLLIDIPGVRNAWIDRHRGLTYNLDEGRNRLTANASPHSIELNGLFDVYLEYDEFVVAADRSFRTRTRAGLAAPGTDGGYIAAGHEGVEFLAIEDALLVSVAVLVEAAGLVVVRLTARGREVARTQVEVADVQAAVRIPLDFALDAGTTYRLDATGTAVNMHRTRQVTYPLGAPSDGVQIVRGYAGGSTPDAGRNAYYFFYDWEVAHDSAGVTKAEVRAAAVERIHANRNLAEDVINVCELRPEEIAVCAEIELRPDVDTEGVQAEILYQLHHHVSPAVPFHSLEEMIARGRTIDEIFEGPLLDHGFIDGDELRAIRRKCEIRASDVVQTIMDVDGVLAVKSLKLLSFLEGELRTQADWQLRLSEDRFRIAVFRPWLSKVIFYKKGLPYYANVEQVKRLFAEKKAADIEAKLKIRPRELTPPPGEARDVGDYLPVQYELPAVYCVGPIVVPDHEPVRQAQSRQLKAYLMFFEQLLVNALAQLSRVSDLFGWRGSAFTTYFTSQLRDILEFDDLDNSANQGHASFRDALESIVETPVRAEERRLRFLEHLAARYAEEFEEYSTLMRSLTRAFVRALPQWRAGIAYAAGDRVIHRDAQYECLQPHTAAAAAPPAGDPVRWRHLARLITHKRHFLDDYPALSAGRGTGFDWRYPEVPQNIAGYQRRAYRLLDIEPVTRRQLAGHRFEIANDGTTDDPHWSFELHDAGERLLFKSRTCDSKASIEALLDRALQLGGDLSNYDPAPGDAHHLVFRCDEDEEPSHIGTTGPGVDHTVVAAYFRQYGESEGFHLVEHILLRRRTRADPFLPVQLDVEDHCCPVVRDPYSFRVSIVLPSWSPRFRDMKFRQLVEDTLRREAPAHVFPRICWINHEQMRELEVALEAWQAQLAALGREPGACAPATGDDGTRTGSRLRPAESPAERAYESALANIAGVLFRLRNVYPLAQLHDCEEVDGDTPQVTLGHTNLGTL